MIHKIGPLVGLGFVFVLMLSLFSGLSGYFQSPPEPSAEHEFHKKPRELHLASNGPLGHYDRQQLQRGFQVYKEVCAACHGLSLVAFRDLAALGYEEPEIKAIANLSPQRSASMPDIPTSDETGVPGLYMSGWFGFWAPKGTPKDIVTKLNSAMVEALADPNVKARFTELGLDVAPREQQTPEGLAKFQQAEIDKWWPIIKGAGISAQAQ